MSNSLESVDPMVVEVMSQLDSASAPDVSARVQICLSEALYNLVLHASAPDPSQPVDIVLTVEGNGAAVALDIYDPQGAAPFDLRDHAPDLSEIDLMAENGRGLALILECADRVDYGSANGRNRLALGFTASPNTPDSEEISKT